MPDRNTKEKKRSYFFRLRVLGFIVYQDEEGMVTEPALFWGRGSESYLLSLH